MKKLKHLSQQPDIDLWFASESGFEGNPRSRRRWDRKGNKTRVTQNGDYLCMNLMGMVCPHSGEFFAVGTSHSDSDTFQALLNEAGKSITFERTANILILDNASWHKRKSLERNGWQLLYLPPYSPDFNPI